MGAADYWSVFKGIVASKKLIIRNAGAYAWFHNNSSMTVAALVKMAEELVGYEHGDDSQTFKEKAVSKKEKFLRKKVVEALKSRDANVTSLSHDWFYSFDRTVALDINKTIVEEDTLKNKNATIALTPAAKRLFKQLEKEPKTRIVLYTFGQDWPKVMDIIHKQFPKITFPEDNCYLIGREKGGHNVYKTKLGTTKDVNGIDFTAHGPIWNGRHEAMGPKQFQQWLDSIHGNIILRATYEPSSILPKPWRKMVASSGTTFYRNSETNVFQTNKPKGTVEIAGRKEKDQNTKGKIIASSLPILAFDDNPIDWEFFRNGEATGQECILAMAPKHYFKSGDNLKIQQNNHDKSVVKKRIKQLGSAKDEDYIKDLFNIELKDRRS